MRDVIRHHFEDVAMQQTRKFSLLAAVIYAGVKWGGGGGTKGYAEQSYFTGPVNNSFDIRLYNIYIASTSHV